jgi:DNA-binding NtrC family response regulator
MRRKQKVFLLDDDELIVAMLARALRKEGYEVLAETEAHGVMEKIRSFHPHVILLDIRMPGRDGMDVLREIADSNIDTEVIMLTADDTAETAVQAMKLGAADYLTKPFHTDEVKIVLEKVIEKEKLQHEVHFLRKAYSEFVEKDLIGDSAPMRSLLAQAEKIARAHVSNILITGESGTGKELVARYIHNLMFEDDSGGQVPFITVNCAAMPESLLESELFGHQKGSFTDAKADKKGLFELAAGGSILLDEIGEMNPGLQSKLLRVLEDRTVRRIGGKGEVPIEVTVIATTNKNLSEAVRRGEFRKDLFFRLSAFYLHIVPLRERRDDVPLLAGHFLRHYAERYKNRLVESFSPEAEKILMESDWPGNVRELKNLVERIVVLENTAEIGPEHIPAWISGHAMSEVSAVKTGNGFEIPDSGIDLEELEKNLIRQALQKSDSNKTLAARLLNMSYDSFRYQVKKFGLE